MIATFKTSDFIANIKAALFAASDDRTCESLYCIRIELSVGVARFVATNGRWLWVNETPYSEVVGTDEKGKRILGTSSEVVHVSVADAKSLLKVLEKGKKAASWDVEFDTAGTVTQCGKRVSFSPMPDVKFPPYAQVVPSVVLEEGKVTTYDPTYIADVMAAFVTVSSEPENCGICIEPSGGELDPVVVTSDTSSALAVLMPRRHSNKPAGSALVARYRVELVAAKAACPSPS